MAALDDLRERWVRRRDEFRKLRASVDGAVICEEVLTDLEVLHRHRSETALTLSQAAEISGFSKDHLARLVRQGKLTNLGRRGAPRIRLSELRRGPHVQLAKDPVTSYDPAADARTLLSRRERANGE